MELLCAGIDSSRYSPRLRPPRIVLAKLARGPTPAPISPPSALPSMALKETAALMLATDQGQGIERRRSPRVPVRKYGIIVFNDSTLPCSVVDESDSGVRLADFRIGSCSREFALRLGEDEPRKCRVVWRSGLALGAQYLEDERIRRLRQNIARFEGLLAAETSTDMMAIYEAEIAAARGMIEELRSAGIPIRVSRRWGSRHRR